MEEDFEKVIQNNTLMRIHKDLYLTHYQKEVLEKYCIPYQNVSNNKELLFYLNDLFDDELYDDLECVASEIADFVYYHQTHK